MRTGRTLVLTATYVLALLAGLAHAQGGPPAKGEDLGSGGAKAPASKDQEAPKAQEEGKAPTTQPAGKPQVPKGLFSGPFIYIMLGGLVLMWVWMGRKRKKQESTRREMLSNLKKGDKVTSIGGIAGTVIEVREDEVTVKVDETNNVRVRFARWAIKGIGEQAKKESPEEKK